MWTCSKIEPLPLTSALAGGDQALCVRVQADAAEDGLLRWLLLLLLRGGIRRVRVEAMCGLGRQQRRRLCARFSRRGR